jgi:hypothetical protein
MGRIDWIRAADWIDLIMLNLLRVVFGILILGGLFLLIAAVIWTLDNFYEAIKILFAITMYGAAAWFLGRIFIND